MKGGGVEKIETKNQLAVTEATETMPLVCVCVCACFVFSFLLQLCDSLS